MFERKRLNICIQFLDTFLYTFSILSAIINVTRRFVLFPNKIFTKLTGACKAPVNCNQYFTYYCGLHRLKTEYDR